MPAPLSFPPWDEMMDSSFQIFVRYPDPPAKGPGILTASGAYVGLTNDFAEEIGLELPELDPATLKKVGEVLPAYGNYGNPLDVTAGFAPGSVGGGQGAARRSEHRHAGRFISFPINAPRPVENFNKGMVGSAKPKVMVALGDTWPLGPDVLGSRAGEPGGVLAIVGSHDARHRALYALWPPARPSKHAHPALSRSRGCPGSARARSPNGWARSFSAAAGIRVPDANLPVRLTKRSQRPSASATRWC